MIYWLLDEEAVDDELADTSRVDDETNRGDVDEEIEAVDVEMGLTRVVTDNDTEGERLITGTGTGGGGRLLGGAEVIVAVDDATPSKENVELARRAVS